MRLFRTLLTLGVCTLSVFAQDGKEKHAYQVRDVLALASRSQADLRARVMLPAFERLSSIGMHMILYTT